MRRAWTTHATVATRIRRATVGIDLRTVITTRSTVPVRITPTFTAMASSPDIRLDLATASGTEATEATVVGSRGLSEWRLTRLNCLTNDAARRIE